MTKELVWLGPGLLCARSSCLKIFVIFMYQVKVTKGEETVTAVFNERIPVFPYIPLTGKLKCKNLGC